MPPLPRQLTKKDFESLSDFRYQMRRFERFSERAAQAEGLTPQQYLVLLHIKGQPGREWASVGDIAERLQLQPHAAVTLVTRCEAQALVERRQSESDRRQVEVHLLPDGQRLLERLAELHRAELRSLKGVFKVPQIDMPEQP
ncbi:MarR family winged helix-turn-helix transcriptional regulator [Roseateles sp. BYS78W]|uniref:MarR family winged helix-turn-helix transcriptional regulator n=1 Tax=Pelomonas candidula TaxID=3299025 RepID=A0ABW7HFM8_9BURK